MEIKELEEVDKYQPLWERLEITWKPTAIVVSVVGALGAVTPKHTQWLGRYQGT